MPLVIATDLTSGLGLDLLVHDHKWHLTEEDDGVCIRDLADKRERAMNLQ